MRQASDSATGPVAPAETVLFSATLFPHRSLSPGGGRLIVALVALVAGAASLPFLLAGAWPVGGFLGLDVALLYWCFSRNHRQARAYEEVLLTRLELFVRRVSWRGKVSEWRFNPVWVRLQAEEDPEYGMQRLAIVQRREEVEIGACLAPFERADFAHSFGQALARARR
ncbi:MAG TPA: DUF2244 domain-containing protein [Beijerinckiaceae bacterium]|nr:DUF2244 domain-containing protein [Beijerinckiaceae bacterium]